jgi:hypothetical protein
MAKRCLRQRRAYPRRRVLRGITAATVTGEGGSVSVLLQKSSVSGATIPVASAFGGKSGQVSTATTAMRSSASNGTAYAVGRECFAVLDGETVAAASRANDARYE